MPNIEIEGGQFVVLDQRGSEMWSKRLAGQIRRAVIADLDADQTPEIVVGVTEKETNIAHPGEHTGKLLVYHANGDLW